ncbi:MAG: GIY-YIG nuclease family protein [Rhodospirillales bacterium]|nr:GIY-YIG nuclease family protein [Rhodospirillales bacterium]
MAFSGMTAWADDAARLPAEPGAYALLIATKREIPHPSRRQGDETGLPAGTYVYLGSARGPGGIRARCARHLRTDKSLRWHVDHLSAVAVPGGVKAVPFPDDTECGLSSRLAARPDLAAAVPGFGNSDCRICESHLFRLHSAVGAKAVLVALRGQ